MLGAFRILLACCLIASVTAVRRNVSMKATLSRKMRQESLAGDWRRPRAPGDLNGMTTPQDLCQNVIFEQKLVVAARLDEDVSWMATDLVPWQQFLVYAIKNEGAATHKIDSDTGRESQAYLQFIYDYYECLPEAIVFIHAHHSSPHSPDIVSDLKRLQWQAIPGFMSMSRPQRLNTFYFLDYERQKPDPNDTTETAHWAHFASEQNALIRKVWGPLFQQDLGDIPSQLTAAAGGQFAVTSKSLKRHPRSFYAKALKWLRTTPEDGFWAGLVFEQLWSYILGAGTDYKHPPECDVYLCDRDGSSIIPKWEAIVAQKPNLTQSVS